jgi:NitT/TauT family transport system substrate-binding protein
MSFMMRRCAIGFALLLIVAVIPWRRFVVPRLTQLPDDFSYTADVVSYDRFFDPETQKFLPEQRSVTDFSYQAVRQDGGVLIVRNAINVRKITGEHIFTVERFYGIDPVTGMQVPGTGDHDRDGYLFAPANLLKGQSFTYWHVNYDGPAHMKFTAEEKLFGLTVYHYETDYSGVRIDQTENLSSLLPGVGVTRGVELEPRLHLWVEPNTGSLVKYEDDTVAYYYDLQTGTRLMPWNHFRNGFSVESVRTNVERARLTYARRIALSEVVPLLFVCLAVLLGGFALCERKMCRALVCTLAIGAVLGFVWVRLPVDVNVEAPYAGPVERIRIGAEAGLLASPVWIAEHNGYFREHGIDIEIQEFDSGRAAFMQLLQSGDLGIATVAQTPLVSQSFERSDYAVIAGMVTSSNDVKVLARADSGIQAPSDLRGKKIGVTKNTTGHYFLSLLLSQYGLRLQDVTLVEFDTSMLSSAVVNGTVDAISSWEPHIYEARMRLGGRAVVFESRGSFREDFYFVAMKEWIREHPELAQRFLAAIDDAQAFIVAHPKLTQALVAQRLHLDPQFVESVWDDFSFGLFLDQAILLSFEQQARWMIATGAVEASVIPNYLTTISFDALDTIRPDTISVIR